MQLAIEIDGQGRDKRPSPVGHRGALIVFNESRSGWVSFIACMDRQAATGQDQGRRKGMRCEKVMEQDDGEEEKHALHEDAAGCNA